MARFTPHTLGRGLLAALFAVLAGNAAREAVAVPLGQSDSPLALAILQAIVALSGGAAAWGIWSRARWAPAAAVAYGLIAAGMLVALVPLVGIEAEGRNGI